MDRIAERHFAANPKANTPDRRPLRSDAKRLTDAELLARLRSFGIDLDRSSLERLCDRALSAQEIAEPMLDRWIARSQRETLESDWIWICVSALWQRWFPDKPSVESLDDKMQSGYELLASAGPVAACRAWLDAWTEVLRILDKTGMQSIEEFDGRFQGSQSLFNWIQDLESELWNAGLRDRQFLAARIAMCEETLRRFPAEGEGEGDLLTENRRRALGESWYELGETGKAEALYREWLEADPRWGWGWIGWSDSYRFTRTERRDLQRTEQLLREGLGIAEVRDRADLVERLADLYDDQGRDEEARQLRVQVAAARKATTSSQVRTDGRVLRKKLHIAPGDKGLPLGRLSKLAARMRRATSQPQPPAIARRKVGRNEPCPCGSGKKFKKCCGV